MNETDIHGGRRYRGCNGAVLAVEKVEDGRVFYRINGTGTRTSMELCAFAPLIKHEIINDSGAPADA